MDRATHMLVGTCQSRPTSKPVDVSLYPNVKSDMARTLSLFDKSAPGATTQRAKHFSVEFYGVSFKLCLNVQQMNLTVISSWACVSAVSC
jgi:hypothetical protein